MNRGGILYKQLLAEVYYELPTHLDVKSKESNGIQSNRALGNRKVRNGMQDRIRQGDSIIKALMMTAILTLIFIRRASPFDYQVRAASQGFRLTKIFLLIALIGVLLTINSMINT